MVDIIPPSALVLAKIGIETSVVKSIKPCWKRTHYRAVINWLTKYKTQPYASNLEKIRAFLEAFHHLCEVEDWEKAGEVLGIPLNIPTNEELHLQLGKWGYYQQEIELYGRILGKLDVAWDCLCLNSLGNAYRSQGNYSASIAALQTYLEIALAIADRHGVGKALGGLGNVCQCLGDYQNAIYFYERSLKILQELGDRKGEGAVLGNLGAVYTYLEDYQAAINYYQQSLAIVREIGKRYEEGGVLGNLGVIYNELKIYSSALDYAKQHLTMAREIGDRHGEGIALGNFGNISYSQGDYRAAIDYHQESLAIAREIGSLQQVENALGNLSNAYRLQGDYSTAIHYQQQGLAIAQEIGDMNGTANSWLNLGVILARLDRKWEAIKAFQNARDFYQAIGLEHHVEECNSYIRQVGVIAVAQPMKAPEITVTLSSRKYFPSVLRGNRLQAMLLRFVRKVIRWVKYLFWRLWELVRVK